MIIKTVVIFLTGINKPEILGKKEFILLTSERMPGDAN